MGNQSNYGPLRPLGPIRVSPPDDSYTKTKRELFKDLLDITDWTQQDLAAAISNHKIKAGSECNISTVKSWVNTDKMPRGKNRAALFDLIESLCVEGVDHKEWIQALLDSGRRQKKSTTEKSQKARVISAEKNNQTFEGVVSSAINWEILKSSGKFEEISSKERVKIDGWMSDDSMPQIEELLSISAALDIDIVTVLNLNEDGLIKEFNDIQSMFQGSSNKRSVLRQLWGIFSQNTEWPSNSLIQQFYKRSWFSMEFEHTANHMVNHYALIKISTLEISSTHPIAFHFAFRNKGRTNSPWRPYGSVIRSKNQVNLVHISGEIQTKKFKIPEDLLQVETHFGSGPAEFKISSIHKFLIKVEYPSSASEDVLRFWA